MCISIFHLSNPHALLCDWLHEPLAFRQNNTFRAHVHSVKQQDRTVPRRLRTDYNQSFKDNYQGSGRVNDDGKYGNIMKLL